MIMAPTTHSWLFLILMLSVYALPSSSEDAASKSSLIAFLSSLTNAELLVNNWTRTAKLCEGNTRHGLGVLCKNDAVNGLQLENMNLGGKIDVASLAPLNLFSLSLMNNNFSGPIPSDINKLGRLRRLFLSYNNFSGEIGDKAFIGITQLKQVDLANNMFEGKLPSSLIRVSELGNLTVQNNLFEGKIPDFWQENMVANFSNNRLKGAIPDVLSHEDASMFSGKFFL